MILRRLFVFCLGVTAVALGKEPSREDFVFREVKYFHRWSQGTQHEFTPAKQEDLDHWTDMITINAYPAVDDGEKMAGTANAVLGNYRSHQGKILKTSSVPATDDKPAEHFIAVRFNRPGLVETAFARFKLVEGKAYSFIYSHRFYGDEAAAEMDTWLKANGETVENALLDWDAPIPPKS